MSSVERAQPPARARSAAGINDTVQAVSGDNSTAPGGSRPPSRLPRRQLFTPTPGYGRSRPQSRFSTTSRPGTSLGVRRSGGDLLMQPRESDAIQTFLRIRPPSEDVEIDERQPYPSFLRMMNKSEVLLIPPEDDLKARNRVPEQFSFARVFPYNAEQMHIFRNTTMPLVQDLLKRGRDALVLAYGVTNSGKTFTVQGDRTNPGMLPRSLNTLFSTIEDRMTDLKMRPVRFCEVELCDDLAPDSAETVIRAASANRPKRLNRKEPPLTVESLAADVVTPKVLEPERMPVDERYRYSVWVSFAEIYTEKAYDLLNITEAPNAKRKNLIITHCPATGAKYMHGLREVHVRSIEEAYAILELGQRNRTVFSTLLNQTSSRSHSIFTVKLLKIPIDVTEETLLERLDEVAMCRMSIVDLAGQERNKRTQNTGQRLKEAGNINQSLMVLGQCLEALRHNQANPTKPVVVPYRHSKLTELFQGFFFGEGRATMIVNLNPFDTNYHETSHVVRFAAAAREVNINKLENHYRRRRPASRGNDFDDDDFDFYPGSMEDDLEEQDEYIESLLAQITELRQKWMEAEARLSRREAEIREEMTAEMETRARQMENAFAERLRRELSLKEEAMKAAKDAMVNQGDQTDEDIHHTCREEADRLRRELDEKLALLAERDARIASLQSELKSVNVTLAEVTQRLETADSLIVSLREELAHERDQADIARRTALEQTDALHEQMTTLQADLERIQAVERELNEKWEAEQRRTEGLQEELKASQQETTAERERADAITQQLALLQAGLDRQRGEIDENNNKIASDAQRIQALLSDMEAAHEETRQERERSDSVVKQLEQLQQELGRERLLAEEGRRGEAAEASRVHQLLEELEIAQNELHSERRRVEQFAEKETTANNRVRELLAELEQIRDQLRVESESGRTLTDKLETVQRELLAEKTRAEALTSTAEARAQLLAAEAESARKEIVTLERTLVLERNRLRTVETERKEVERLRSDELKRLRQLLMELERACRETRDVKREREVALTEVDILRDRLHRDRQRIKDIRNELLRIDYTTPPEDIIMTSEELVLELRRAVRAADLERDHYESRIDEYEAASLQYRLERQELLDKNVQLRRVVHKMSQDMAANTSGNNSGNNHGDKSMNGTMNLSIRSSTRSQRFSVNTETFFRSLFHRRPKIPDFDVTSDDIDPNSQEMSHLSVIPPEEDGRSTSATTNPKRKSGLKKVVSALRGNGTARVHTPQALRRLSKAIRRRGRKSAVVDDETECSPSSPRQHTHDNPVFFNDTMEMSHDKSFSDQQNSMTLASDYHVDTSILDTSLLAPVDMTDPAMIVVTSDDKAHSPKLKNRRSFLGSDAPLSSTIKVSSVTNLFRRRSRNPKQPPPPPVNNV